MSVRKKVKIGLSSEDKQQMKNEVIEEVNENYDTFEEEVKESIAEVKETLSGLGQLTPSGTSLESNILAFTENKGIWIATDTGHWYYYDELNESYTDGGVYQAVEIADGSVTEEKLDKITRNNFYKGNALVRSENFDVSQTSYTDYALFDFVANVGDKIIVEHNIKEFGSVNLLATYEDGTRGVLINDVYSNKSVVVEKNIVKLGYWIRSGSNNSSFDIKLYIDNEYNINKIVNNLEELTKNEFDKTYEVCFNNNHQIELEFDTTEWNNQEIYEVHKCYYKANTPLSFETIDYEFQSYSTINVLAKYSDGTQGIIVQSLAANKTITITPTKDIIWLGAYVNVIGDKFTLQITPLTTNNYENKKILFIGDSITAMGTSENGWISYFNNIIKPNSFINVAVSGAKWKDNTTGIAYDGNPTYDNLNFIGNQVQKVINNKELGTNGYEDFDIIIISAGTNDDTDTDISLEKQFTVDGDGITILPLENVNRTMFNGAIRYSVEKLQEIYPNAQIFLCTPIQSASIYRPYDRQLSKGNSIKEVADRLSIPYIDTFKCGIYSAYEIENGNGKYLQDGLHPNVEGAKKIAEYNARAIINWFNH